MYLEKKESVFFENIQYHILHALNSARVSIKICVAWITWDVYAPHLKKLASRGVKIIVIYNNDCKNSKANLLDNVDGIELLPINARRQSSLMHNKFCVIDDSILVTGSFNWSRTAESHFENIVILRNHFVLVNAFNHEFDDLMNYFESYKNRTVIHCLSTQEGNRYPCRSHAYYVGVLGAASGIHEGSTVDVWKICNAYKHAEKISTSDEIFLNSNLFGDEYDFDDEEVCDQHSMREIYVKERARINRVRQYFQKRHGMSIHAVGYANLMNHNEYLKGYESPEHALSMIWIDMYYRKTIPFDIYEWESDDIEGIICESLNSVDGQEW
ncbi:phospholipase D-like domain-containing protein [Pseudomonas neuropathica]